MQQSYTETSNGMNKRTVTFSDIRQAAARSRRASPPSLIGKDFLWEVEQGIPIRFIVIGRCREPGKGTLWTVRPTNVTGTGSDLDLTREQIEDAVARKLAEQHVRTDEQTGIATVR